MRQSSQKTSNFLISITSDLMYVKKLTFLCPSDQVDTLQLTEPSQTALGLSHNFLSQCNQKAYRKH